MRRILVVTFVAAAASFLSSVHADDAKAPDVIMSAIKGRFPEAEVKSVEKELEGGKTMYDVELTAKSRKYEMDIKEDGTIIEIEKEVAAKDFPESCAKAVAEKFPKAAVKEIMEVNKVEGKTETPIHYEVVLQAPGEKSFEAIVALDGKSVETEKPEPPATK